MSNDPVKKTCLIVVTAFLGGFATIGCSDDDDQEGAEEAAPASNVDPSKSAADVTPEEATAVCESIASYYRSKVPVQDLCIGAGFQAYGEAFASGGEPEAACDEAVAECVQGGAEDFVPTCEEEEVPDGCTSTVGEVETCLKAIVDAQVAAFESAELPGCGGILEFIAERGTEGLEEAFETDPGDLPECENVDEECI